MLIGFVEKEGAHADAVYAELLKRVPVRQVRHGHDIDGKGGGVDHLLDILSVGDTGHEDAIGAGLLIDLYPGKRFGKRVRSVQEEPVGANVEKQLPVGVAEMI